VSRISRPPATTVCRFGADPGARLASQSVPGSAGVTLEGKQGNAAVRPERLIRATGPSAWPGAESGTRVSSRGDSPPVSCSAPGSANVRRNSAATKHSLFQNRPTSPLRFTALLSGICHGLRCPWRRLISYPLAVLVPHRLIGWSAPIEMNRPPLYRYRFDQPMRPKSP